MWLWLFLVSLFFNVLSLLYVRWLLKTMAIINQDMEDLQGLLSQFASHVKSVHDLEMFYGDETLKSLMSHSSEIIEKIENLDLILNEKEEEDDTTDEA